MRIGKTLPPASAPVSLSDIINGFLGIVKPDKYIFSLQKSICSAFNKKHAFLFSSGKAALTISLRALHKQHSDRNIVVVPAFNCYSVPSSIIRAGLIVRPCEIDIETLQFKKESLQEILTESNQILAIMPTHLFGLPSDLNIPESLTHDNSVTIIEDAAQAMGSVYDNRYLGTSGDIGIFSFARGKAISACEGGVIVTDSDVIASLISGETESIDNYTKVGIIKLIIQIIAMGILINPYFFWLPRLIPSLKLGETTFDRSFSIRKFSGFQAGLVKKWKQKIESLNHLRNERIMMYSNLLSGNNNFKLLPLKYDISSLSCIRFPIYFENHSDAERLFDFSEKHGLGIARTYPDAISNLQIDGIINTKCENAEIASKNILTLPCHSMVSLKDIKRIAKAVLSIAQK